jgi:hypothetical protein
MAGTEGMVAIPGPQGAQGVQGVQGVQGPPGGPGRRVFADTGVSNAAGTVTFTFIPPFAAPPVVAHAVQTAISDITECRVASVSASAVTFNVRRAPAVTLLGISVLQVPQPAQGVTVHCHAVEAGQA